MATELNVSVYFLQTDFSKPRGERNILIGVHEDPEFAFRRVEKGTGINPLSLAREIVAGFSTTQRPLLFDKIQRFTGSVDRSDYVNTYMYAFDTTALQMKLMRLQIKAFNNVPPAYWRALQFLNAERSSEFHCS